MTKGHRFKTHTQLEKTYRRFLTQHDAGFLRNALPVTGRMQKPELNPFRAAGTYTPEEERTIALNGIATLPDREGWGELRTHGTIPSQVEMRMVIFSFPF